MLGTNKQPTRLTHLDGIGYKLASRIERHYNDLRNEWKKYGAHDNLFARLESQPDMFHGGDTLSEQEILTLIAFNPYELRQVRGINFKKADTVALNNYGVDLDHPARHAAGNQSIIEQHGPLREYELDKHRERAGLRNRQRARDGIILDHDRAWIESELEAEQDLAQLFEDVLTSSTNNAPADLTGLDLGPLNADQLNAVQTALSGVRIMALTGGAGTGKCLAPGTPILMHDGRVIPVEDVRVGDQLMGPDSRPRNVLSLASGRERMYRVTPRKGDPYVVNESHILSLKMSERGGGYQRGDIVNISITDYLAQSDRFRAGAKGWRTGVDFNAQPVSLDPYVLGIWLGDGASHQPEISVPDQEVREYLTTWAGENGLEMTEQARHDWGSEWRFTANAGKGGNPFMNALNEYDLIRNKHIPLAYRANSRSVRLQLLAGILDADGHLDASGCFDIITKHEQFAHDIAYLSRSLGFAAHVKPCEKSCIVNGEKFTGTYYRLCISGHLDEIPTRIIRKQAKPRKQRKDVLVTGITVEPLDVGDYYGFEIDGDHLFLLGDFTVTHNTRTTAAIAHAAKKLKKSMRVMAFAGKAAMRSQEAMGEDGVHWIECSTIHRALGLKGQYSHPNELYEDIIILDEASMIPNWLMAKVVNAMRPTATLILVGDPNQLPPIGYGTPFQDFLELGLPHIHLETNYRQAGQVSIHQFAEAIRTQNPNAYQHGDPERGVYLRFGIDPVTAELDFNALISDANQRLPHHDWQVVTWKNDTKDALNALIQELLNPNGVPLFTYRVWSSKDARGNYADASVCIGDKIIVTDNDYDHGVFNGQTGKITDYENGELIIDFGPGEGTKSIPLDDAQDLLQLGYCVTVHKAQGSGWDTVIVYQPEPVRYSPRRFYYTSVTRAKNHVHLITTLTRRDYWVNVLKPDEHTTSTLQQRVQEAR